MLRSAWRSLLHHKLRLVLSGIAIVLGVGFVVGTLIFTDTLNSTFTNLFADTTTDVVVTPEQDVEGRGFAGHRGHLAGCPARRHPVRPGRREGRRPGPHRRGDGRRC